MTEQSLEAACRECGRPLSFHPQEERPVRCQSCFDTHLRQIDHEFLASYAKLGVTGRRVVAETCLRGLALESPPARKVLAMAIMEQFLLASADLIGLMQALRDRERESIVRSFLSFRLDGDASQAFFAELGESGERELLAAFGLPPAAEVTLRYPGIEGEDAEELSGAITSLLRDLRATAERGTSAYLLATLAESVRGGPALTETAAWLEPAARAEALRGDQVASLVLDERKRQLVVQAVPVDEDRLGEVVDAIDCMTRASSNLIYAFLTVQDEEARLR